jgi:hypothetical protein
MLGLSVFWRSFRFKQPSSAFYTLFSLMLGDEISNTFNELQQIDYIFGALYMFWFIFFGMSVMMNLFLIIIGDSFDVVQETHKFNWLTDVIPKDAFMIIFRNAH